ncbi:MAG: ATP-binding protein [candidate division Zixibacteria bacterium]|jgi:signal transduction histidine kinase|nr:ATP-binding protein [candidate division Zixibacteria bacterium]
MTVNSEYIPTGAAARNQLVDKQILALDALVKMTRQFATRPDFAHLVEVLLLTTSGQFSVTSAFALVGNPRAQVDSPFFCGIGRFKGSRELATLGNVAQLVDYIEDGPGSCLVADMRSSDRVPERLHETLTRVGVAVIAPLYHGDSLAGILGLGAKVSGRPFEPAEVKLLSMLAGTISPMLASSYLFLEIARLNAWYLEILDNVKQGVFVFNVDNMLVKVNDSGRQILRSVNPMLAALQTDEGLSLREIFCESAFPGWARRIDRARTMRRGRVSESLVASVGSSERIFAVSATMMNREESADMLITLEDITRQKETDQRMFNLEKFADKGVMASSISHELNNFLGLILGGVEISQMNLAKGKTEKVETALEKLKSHVAKMERFTSGLMDYTRLDTKKAEADLNAVVADVLSFVSIQKRFSRIAVQVHPDHDLPTFELDTDQIAQLLLNFANNAADAIRETGRDNGEITIRTARDGDCVLLTVSDNGVGIAPDIKERLFKTHLTTKPGGHGYGLVTCARIIQNHGADVEIDSEPGQGTTFRLRFPLHPAPVAQ